MRFPVPRRAVSAGVVDMSRSSASKFGSSSAGAEVAESANSTFSGDHNIVIETVLHEGGKPRVFIDCLH